jgi:hypothetical protein
MTMSRPVSNDDERVQAHLFHGAGYCAWQASLSSHAFSTSWATTLLLANSVPEAVRRLQAAN